MRILIPILGFGNSGGYRVLSQLANHWCRTGHSVTFICPNKGMLPYYPTDAKVLWVNELGIESEQPVANSSDFYHLLKGIKALIKGINKNLNGYDVVLATQSLTTYPIFFSSFKEKKFYYIQAYEPDYYYTPNSIKTKIMRLMSWFSYYLPFKRIGNADVYKEYKNIRTIDSVYPGVDLENFKPALNSDLNFLNSKSPIKIGCIGRIEPYKGTQYVVEAFLKMVNEYDIKLYIAFGDITATEVNKNIIVSKPLSDKELADFYQSLDIIIAPGTIQLGAIHYPVIEGMACGVPVITTNYFPATDKNAWTVPIKDSEAIIKTIKKILKNPEIAIKKSRIAMEDVKEFDWGMVSEKMINIFENS